MIKLFAIIITAGLLFLSCGKKNEDTVKKQTPNQQTTQNKQQQKENPSMVDFSWRENGKDIKLSDYKGKVIVVNFWATWCGPCRKELPSLSQISSELKDKDFKLIGVSVDQEQADLKGFLKSYDLSYSIVHKPDKLLEQYMSAAGQNQNVIPQTYIIDKNGKVVEVVIGARTKSDFLSLINKYL
jgi:thiol-disulfide isomerase/thioredoxin